MSRRDPPSTPAEPGPFAFLTRRRLLGLGLGGAAVAAGGVAGLAWMRGPALATPGLKCLSAHDYQTLVALARTHVPPGGPFADGADDAELARQFDAFLADQPEADATDAGRALDLVEFGPLLFERRATTFSRLDEAGRLAHWQGWATSERALQREIWWAFARFFGLVFYDRPQVWDHIGYPGPSLRQVRG